MDEIVKNKVLYVNGKVSEDIMKTLLPGKSSTNWFFVLYAESEVSKDAKLQLDNTSIKILDITDAYGHDFNVIPQGYKTLCHFKFTSGIPEKLNILPICNDWTGKTKVELIVDK